MKVNFNVAADNTTQGSDEIVHLAWVGAADGVSNADAVDADLVDGLVDGEEIDEVGTEGIFC